MPNLIALDKKLRRLAAKAEAIRKEDRREALEDIAELKTLLPARARPARERAAALLAGLDDPRTLSALDAETIDEVVAEHLRMISPSTGRRMIADHRRRPATKSQERKLDLIANRIRAHFKSGDAHAWDIGKEFDRLAKSRLYRLTKHRTLEAWANAIFPNKGYPTLARYRRIAKSFTRATAIRFGTEKLDLGLRYLDLTPAEDRPAELPRLMIPVPGKGEIPFTKITVSDLEKAVAALTTEVSTPRRAKLPRGAATLEKRARKTFAALRLPPGHPRPSIDSRVLRIDGRTVAVFTIHNLPQDFLNRVIASGADS